MLTYEDEPTIRNAMMKRLDDKTKGMGVADIIIVHQDNCIKVAVWVIIIDRIQNEGLIDVRSHFDLPESFDIKHLHNEIDEIYDGCQKAREAAKTRLLWNPGADQRKPVLGTGLRGRWPQ